MMAEESLVCGGCHLKINGSFLQALGKVWHLDHFTCKTCSLPVGDEFHLYKGEQYCRQHYLELATEKCFACGKLISAKRIKALGHQYHPECFACDVCHVDVLQEFYTLGDKVYCRLHINNNTSSNNNSNNNTVVAPLSTNLVTAPVAAAPVLAPQTNPNPNPNQFFAINYPNKPTSQLPTSSTTNQTITNEQIPISASARRQSTLAERRSSAQIAINTTISAEIQKQSQLQQQQKQQIDPQFHFLPDSQLRRNDGSVHHHSQHHPQFDEFSVVSPLSVAAAGTPRYPPLSANHFNSSLGVLPVITGNILSSNNNNSNSNSNNNNNNNNNKFTNHNNNLNISSSVSVPNLSSSNSSNLLSNINNNSNNNNNNNNTIIPTISAAKTPRSPNLMAVTSSTTENNRRQRMKSINKLHANYNYSSEAMTTRALKENQAQEYQFDVPTVENKLMKPKGSSKREKDGSEHNAIGNTLTPKRDHNHRSISSSSNVSTTLNSNRDINLSQLAPATTNTNATLLVTSAAGTTTTIIATTTPTATVTATATDTNTTGQDEHNSIVSSVATSVASALPASVTITFTGSSDELDNENGNADDDDDNDDDDEEDDEENPVVIVTAEDTEKDADGNVIIRERIVEPKDIIGGYVDGYFRIRAATLPKLLERLTSKPDMEFFTTFMLTYRSFIDTNSLFKKCVELFEPGHADGKNPESPIYAIRLRVANVFKYWLDKLSHDFVEDREFAKEMERFLTTDLFEFNKEAATKLLRKLQDILINVSMKDKNLVNLSELSGKSQRQKPPNPIIPKKISSGESLSLLDIDPIEFARQMTILEFAYFGNIRPAECLNQGWNKPNKLKLAPNMMNLIGKFNRASYFVATQIVTEKDNSKRQKILKYFIKVGVALKDLNNFNGMMEVMTGLQTSAVHRLKKTWAGISKKKMANFTEMKVLLSSDSSFKRLRYALHQLNPPCVPYLGMYLTDLTFIEDGNPDVWEGLINFDKRYLLARVIQEIQLYQDPPYNLKVVAEIQSYLQFLHAVDPDELYDMSLEIEPRADNSRYSQPAIDQAIAAAAAAEETTKAYDSGESEA